MSPILIKRNIDNEIIKRELTTQKTFIYRICFRPTICGNGTKNYLLLSKSVSVFNFNNTINFKGCPEKVFSFD